MARSPVWKCGCMLTPLVTTYRVEPPMLLGAKKCHATATSAINAPVRRYERFLSRFFTVGGHCCLPYKRVWESATEVALSLTLSSLLLLSYRCCWSGCQN